MIAQRSEEPVLSIVIDVAEVLVLHLSLGKGVVQRICVLRRRAPITLHLMLPN